LVATSDVRQPHSAAAFTKPTLSRSKKKSKAPPAAPDALRILQLNTLLNGGGTDDQCLKLTLGLGRLGQKVWLAGPGERPLATQIAELRITQHVTPPEGWLKLKFIFDCARLIREQRIQIVHGHHGRDYWPTILAAYWSRARPKIVLSRHLASSPKSLVSRSLVLGRVDALVAVSGFVGRVLREGHADPDSPEPERQRRLPIKGDPAKIHVIHGGIDTGRFKPFATRPLRPSWGLAGDDFAFGVVGSYDLPRGKGQREFLQAAAKIKDRHPRARFLIIGRGSMAALLMDDIRKLGLEGRAMLIPYANDMPAVMNTLDSLVHPAIGTEALGLVVCEAHACGRPVIASALDGIPEAFAVGGLGRLVAPEKVEELAAAMDGQLHAPQLSDDERRRIHDRVEERFSIEVSARNHLALYQKLIG
jgi:glycosyltransferase involved in cell wall biosynthesis